MPEEGELASGVWAETSPHHYHASLTFSWFRILISCHLALPHVLKRLTEVNIKYSYITATWRIHHTTRPLSRGQQKPPTPHHCPSPQDQRWGISVLLSSKWDRASVSADKDRHSDADKFPRTAWMGVMLIISSKAMEIYSECNMLSYTVSSTAPQPKTSWRSGRKQMTADLLFTWY